MADLAQRAVDDVLAVLAEGGFAIFQDLDDGHRLHRAPLPERGGVEVGFREDFFLEALEAGGVGLVELEFFPAGFGAVLPVRHGKNLLSADSVLSARKGACTHTPLTRASDHLVLRSSR